MKKVAQIPGWGGNAVPASNVAQVVQTGQVSQVPVVGLPAMPVAITQRDSIPVSAETLLNGTIRNQADIANLDQASIASGIIK